MFDVSVLELGGICVGVYVDVDASWPTIVGVVVLVEESLEKVVRKVLTALVGVCCLLFLLTGVDFTGDTRSLNLLKELRVLFRWELSISTLVVAALRGGIPCYKGGDAVVCLAQIRDFINVRNC